MDNTLQTGPGHEPGGGAAGVLDGQGWCRGQGSTGQGTPTSTVHTRVRQDRRTSTLTLTRPFICDTRVLVDQLWTPSSPSPRLVFKGHPVALASSAFSSQPTHATHTPVAYEKYVNPKEATFGPDTSPCTLPTVWATAAGTSGRARPQVRGVTASRGPGTLLLWARSGHVAV